VISDAKSRPTAISSAVFHDSKALGILVAVCSTKMFPSDSFVNVSKALFGIAKISQPKNLGFWQTIGVWRVKPTTESLSVRTLS
jgi:hypothetical protein